MSGKSCSLCAGPGWAHQALCAYAPHCLQEILAKVLYFKDDRIHVDAGYHAISEVYRPEVNVTHITTPSASAPLAERLGLSDIRVGDVIKVRARARVCVCRSTHLCVCLCPYTCASTRACMCACVCVRAQVKVEELYTPYGDMQLAAVQQDVTAELHARWTALAERALKGEPVQGRVLNQCTGGYAVGVAGFVGLLPYAQVRVSSCAHTHTFTHTPDGAHRHTPRCTGHSAHISCARVSICVCACARCVWRVWVRVRAGIKRHVSAHRHTREFLHSAYARPFTHTRALRCKAQATEARGEAQGASRITTY